jgi:farnesyl-diphosphate farnesyltransferase
MSSSETSPDFYALLKDTSRSFYLGIMGLRQPLRDRICCGYLFCRLMDIFEDASQCAPEPRARLLASLRVFLTQLKLDSATVQVALHSFEQDKLATSEPLETYFIANPHERALYEHSPTLLARIAAFPLSVRVAFSGSLMDMALGMESEIAAELSRPPRWERSAQDFDQYCYTVAGTVGIFLTQLFWDEQGFEAKRTLPEMEKLGESFGKALQIVNITKDFHGDWQEGRCFWPRVLGPGGVGTVPPTATELAPALSALEQKFSKHIENARNYISGLSSQRNDIRFFCDFPLQMAERTMAIALSSEDWLTKGEAPKVAKTETLLLLQKLGLFYALPSLWKD